MKNEITISAAQKMVDQWIKKFGVRYFKWNAIKDKQIREIIDIRKSLFFR